MTKNLVSISEYGYIGCSDSYKEHSKYVSKHISCTKFLELEKFHKNAEKPIFSYVPNCDGNVLQAINNYVGVIQTHNLTLEILPKIYQDKQDEIKTRKILNNMLLTIYDIPTETEGSNADLDNLEGMNILEVFIKMFAQSVDELIKKGIKSDYITQEDNLYYLKGKIKFSDHIRYNLSNKERFYVEFDEYLPDRVENRLVKSCIKYLFNLSQDSENQKMLREQLFFFDQVSYSTNIEYDLSCVKALHRGMEYYETPLKLAKIFLQNRSFTPTIGDDSAFSFLFPMDKIFESYVEVLLKENIDDVQTKFRKNYLLENENKSDRQINLEPDYTFKRDGAVVVADAKWKLYDNEDKTFNDAKLKREDIFQVYSYMHYFNAQMGYIFAPNIYDTTSSNSVTYKFQQKEGEIEKKLKIVFIDLENSKQKTFLN